MLLNFNSASAGLGTYSGSCFLWLSQKRRQERGLPSWGFHSWRHLGKNQERLAVQGAVNQEHKVGADTSPLVQRQHYVSSYGPLPAVYRPT